MAEVFRKLTTFSHTEFSEGKFRDPNYVYARIACGYGVLPSMWKQPEKLTLVDFDARAIFLPKDKRFDFLRHRIGFKDLRTFQLNRSGIAAYQPEDCILNLSVSGVGRLL
jgi:hypothetical protein